jgi:hypothetical protein
MATPTKPKTPKLGRHALDRFRDLVASGGFARAATIDRQTGELLDAEARALFASLPAVTPATTVDELCELGLLIRPPANLSQAYARPKYRVGRELFVRTTVSFKDDRRGAVGGFDAAASPAITHRATLKARHGDELLVEVGGVSSLLAFPKSEIFEWNEPHGVPATGGTLSGVQIDYNDPLMKAHVAAAMIDLADDVARLDFRAEDTVVRERQRALVHRLAARVRMSFVGRGDGYAGPRVASLLWGGQGVSFVQRAAAAALLQPFARLLAFELQVAVGRTLRHRVSHGFLVITLRPSLTRWVSDPAWAEPLTDLRIACFDAGWGHDRRLTGFEGQAETVVSTAELDLPEQEVA